MKTRHFLCFNSGRIWGEDLVYIVLCLGDQSICFSDFDSRNPSIGVNLRGPQALNIPNCNPQPKNV